MQRGLVGSEMCIRDRYQRRVHGQVKMTNLVQQGMTLSLARTDFTELYNGSYFHPQYEQLMSNKNGRSTFSKQLRVEHDKVQWADTILFVFPYYVMYVPSIMKSWMERVFSDGFAYNSTGGLGGRKAMLLYSTGADKDFLKEIEPVFWAHIHGNFKFMNLTSLKPFTAYAVAQKTDEERKKYLDEVEKIMYDLENREIYEP
eukprot:TRINITY_DN6369_c0_g1_i5.p1 TRINITY_DN6369_c0_g1~~TRINITY_DN6369_c0_g1_i5.p1  ORF type:complete len:201 (+),score=46.10 TRINITY_DN6369_c0_g1_i5:104-706(+)